MTRVLACIDASVYGASVCDHAAWAARHLRTGVELLHVLDRAPDAVPADLSDGAYIVDWRVISADGHPISGAWTFRVGEGGAAAPDDLVERARAGLEPSTASSGGCASGGRLLQGGLGAPETSTGKGCEL